MELQTNEKGVRLREVKESDLPIFFEQQLDPAANYMAAFTSKDPSDEVAFLTHWKNILSNLDIQKMTILCNGCVAGNILKFEQFGNPEVSYWIGKQYWGKGIASEALLNFLPKIKVRPLYARAAKDNLASIRVLEKCGFERFDEDKGYSHTRGKEVEEFILKLESGNPR
ncbi:GNAT family N-acetyltransferase [Peribacillus simplex]|uniref:GNAT family N-acetyltransferase n=1 Tax=Peribacillus simplex NBRC 15720 = DSM 1321 TaxID=1349754 RepID=A0A223EJF4_9BACI|nr:GNAT family N-acetyltransferase [Peribacillus simplex]ASS95382.1 GNAT family N-acetyltransferase [Peribacillus simplex NBRC 15720 = DSM 1321]MEC1399970.1 GNAT family N-acetyltransferase [Peribacillus simplex]